MAIFHKGLPRRAVVGAFIGFLYGLLLMSLPGTYDFAAGAGWCLLSIALLFGNVFAYYTYTTWALLWMAWRAVLVFQGAADGPIAGVIKVLVPLVSLTLLSASGYVETVRESRPE